MELYAEGLSQALAKLIALDRDVLSAASASLAVSGTATALSVLIGVPLGVLLGLSRFRFRELVLSLVYTGMGLPPVVVGLFVVTLVFRTGPLGALDWLCTREAMVIAQVILAAPNVIGLTAAALQSVDPMLRLQVLSLGATRAQLAWALIRESRLLIIVAILAGFAAVISEIGASLMTGCNVKGDTRILTTAIALEANKGEFGSAFALAFILLALVFAITTVTTRAQQRAAPP